ncbi:MAG: sigma-54-dependent Fis family transcriptional regulator [Betaproteobacteria bacterium HGW-Betaproteobacteria-13]|nr:MAG: sigma-54-dependent Fis family transcriptional regulator [Betaproteobacteria bacterium HGW-Betaproteobacteria-13]
MAKLLIVDDEMGIRELLSEILRDEGHDIQLAENAAAARAARNAERPDMVLLDIWMPDTDGITLLKEWSANGQLNMPVVMMSGHGTIDTAVEATRIGAIDYLEKPIALQKLLASVKRGLQRPVASGAPAPLTLAAFTRSAPLRELKRRIEQIADSSRVLLLRVGGGSLAELVARSLQAGGAPWLDLTAVNVPLDINQLQASQGGLLYVAELARLSRAQQKNLAFALERLDRYDLRLVVATERSHDLRTHSWTGGYGELRAAVRSLALATLEEEIGLPEVRRLLAPNPDAAASAIPLDQPLREAREAFERMYFEHHLRLESGNMTRLAEKTGLERTHLYRKLKQLGLQAGRRHEEN